MSVNDPVLTGGCSCGAVRYRAQGPVISHVLCRCASCRRATGALFVPWFTVPLQNFAFTAGTACARQSSPGVWRKHCAACGTALVYENTGSAGDDARGVDITTCSLDEPDAIAPDAHIWSEDDLRWIQPLGRLAVYARYRNEGVLQVPEGIGIPGLVLQQVSYAARDALLSVRVPVFVDEQGVPPQIEEDDRDPTCLHLLATIAGKPVGAARLDLALDGKVGRVAVLKEWRGSGLGRALMISVHRLAATHGLSSLWCHAQLSSLAFYQRLGYVPEGEPFTEAGIIHRAMRYRSGSPSV
jgi:predicted GNAT family N-acyltransferase